VSPPFNSDNNTNWITRATWSTIAHPRTQIAQLGQKHQVTGKHLDKSIVMVETMI
jgi:hypothetical protein